MQRNIYFQLFNYITVIEGLVLYTQVVTIAFLLFEKCSLLNYADLKKKGNIHQHNEGHE